MIAEKVRGNLVILRTWLADRGFPYRDDGERRRVRDRRAQRLVAHAAQHVPFYRELFSRSGIEPDSIRTAEDLRALPIVEKDQLRKDPARFTSDGTEGVSFTTSGTTGMPATVVHDHRALLENIAYAEREREVLCNIIGMKYSYLSLNILYGASTVRHVQSHNLKRSWIPLRPKRVYASVSDPLPAVAELMNRLRPAVLTGYGAYLEMLFRWMAASGTEVYRPKAILYGAEPMSTEGRLFIEERFGIPVLSVYNAVESLRIGYLCEKRRGFHVHDDLCDVRIVDEVGNPMPPGKPGQVVISNLASRGTVLLNYRLGDLAAFSPDSCGCGRRQPLLVDLEGRKEDILFLPDGTFVHPRTIWSVFKSHPAVLNYQLIQREPARFELKLAAANPDALRSDVDSILSKLRGFLGPQAAIDPVIFPDRIPYEGPKFRAVVALRES